MLQRRVVEKIVGIVNRVTFHNPATGWSVLKVEPFGQTGTQTTVTVHQAQVFAGATMEFQAWFKRGFHPLFFKVEYRCTLMTPSKSNHF